MCDYGKIDDSCKKPAVITTIVSDKEICLCSEHSQILIQNLISTTGMKDSEQSDLLIEIIYGELKV